MEGKEGEGTDVWVSGRAQGELWWWMRGRGAACVALLCFAWYAPTEVGKSIVEGDISTGADSTGGCRWMDTFAGGNTVEVDGAVTYIQQASKQAGRQAGGINDGFAFLHTAILAT